MDYVINVIKCCQNATEISVRFIMNDFDATLMLDELC
jgi:hypothetical protein